MEAFFYFGHIGYFKLAENRSDIDLYKGSCVIVDDELRSRNNIAVIIEKYLPGLNIVGVADGGAQARKILSTVSPDILFLDVQMPGEDGFDFLESLEKKDFALVFVTAFEKYALRAIKVSAIDYVMKPINIGDLQKAVIKGLDLRRSQNGLVREVYQKSLGNFLVNLESKEYPETITLPSKGSFVIREVKDIISMVADSNYTKFSFSNNEEILVAKTLKYFADVLDPKLFIRCDRSVIINFHHLDSIDSEKAIMKDGNSFSISRRKKKEVLAAFQKYWEYK